MVIPELGQFALVLALLVAVVQSFMPLWGVRKASVRCMQLAHSAALVQAVLLMLAFFALSWAFYFNDFALVYVAEHSNSALPWWYRLSAVWGGHEGSLLLWVTVLSLWGAMVAWRARSLPLDVQARVLAVLAMIAVGFDLFILLTSNPFTSTLPDFPLDGQDLNPLLQDPGLIVHPPMLYMGYVGFAVPFAFALAGLMGGRLDAAWARWSRPWTLAAWCFLSLGIALGSWWAYYELGWGGWWFWDPVENASFMPWLAGTALLHSLAATEKRGVFKAWTVWLAILAFSLSLLGTFLVRSGVLTSVHAFAADPARGVFILGLLVLVVGGSLLLFALRADRLQTEGRYQWLSRESFFMGNSLLLMVAVFIVLLGTLYPLLADALSLGKISVGPPYFNRLFVPVVLLLMVLLGPGMQVNWKRHDMERLRSPLWQLALPALLLGALLTWFVGGRWHTGVVLAVSASCWVLLWLLRDLWQRSKGSWLGLRRLRASYYGMTLAHLGLVVTVIGAAFVSAFSIERDVRMTVGSRVSVGDYAFELRQFEYPRASNYRATRAQVRVYRGDALVAELQPEKRVYEVQRSPMTEAGIAPGLFRDLYVALGEPLADGVWAVRLHVKPFIRWLWLGALLMAAGGLLSIGDRRYRIKEQGAS